MPQEFEGRTPAYLAHLNAGPFPGRPDPWAEKDDYFHQIHAGLISEILKAIRHPLEALGYYATREASLQVIDDRGQPDLAILHTSAPRDSVPPRWNYDAAALQYEADPGQITERDEPALEALFVYRAPSQLVTVIEIISPGNKARAAVRETYIERRSHYIVDNGVNVLELDLTRSRYRLLRDWLVLTTAYHAAIFLPRERARVVLMDFDAPLKRIAIPLRGEVIPIELQASYDAAYYDHFIARQILSRGDYVEGELPFPTTLSPEGRAACLEAVARWRAALAELEQTTDQE